MVKNHVITAVVIKNGKMVGDRTEIMFISLNFGVGWNKSYD